ncbi:MAG TPA: TadE/TadG family type IV pilus assembly protein [Bryobacteraceae bacterium]|jgi:Flp pilus assembly protein TadG
MTADVLWRPGKAAHGWRRQGQRGQAMVEMGLCLTVLFFMIFGIFQYSQIAYANNFCAYAAQQAGRYASIRGSGSVNALPTSPNPCGTSCTNVSTSDPTTAYVQSMAVGLNTANLTVSTAWSSATGNGNAAGGTVTVTVKYVYNPILSLISANTFTLNSSSTMEVLQ